MTLDVAPLTPDLAYIRSQLALLDHPWTPRDVADVLRSSGMLFSDASLLLTVDALRRDSVGAGPLTELLELPGVTDVLVDGPDRVLIDRGFGLERTAVRFESDDAVRKLAVRLAASVGRRLDDAMPFVDARLPSGVRLHAILSPLADPGTCISLRVPADRSFTFAQWVETGSLAPQLAEILQRVIQSRAAFLVSGGTGSGKTTLLASLLGLVPADQRLLIVEDSRELNPAHPACVRLESRAANSEGAGLVAMTDLVRQALRMRPDRLVVGEIRGAEICDLLMAMNTGHEGGCGTVHANSASDILPRLEALAALGGMSRTALHAQTASALQLVVHVKRCADRKRRVSEIAIFEHDSDGLRVQPAIALDEDFQPRELVGYRRLVAML